MHTPERARSWLRSIISDQADRAVVMQLGGVLVEQPPVLDVSAADPREFWQASRVSDPRSVWVNDTWETFEGCGWRELELAGDSEGPGTHSGSRRLYATAHIGPAAAAAPLALLIHGYAIPFTGFDRWIAWRLRRHGVHTVRIELPFHLRRTVPREQSGDHFFSVDPAYTRTVIRQCVEDTAAVVAWARREVTPDVRLLGTSLGGLVALLHTALVPMQRTVVVAPLCDPAVSFTESRSGAMRQYMGMLGRAGTAWRHAPETARDVLERSLAPVVPRRLRPVTPPDRITIVESAEDGIVGAAPMETLAEIWGTPIWRYPHGHITVMNAPGLASRLVAHLSARIQGTDATGGLALAG
jgi:hypothetical protein